jgi:hypothetical protein
MILAAIADIHLERDRYDALGREVRRHVQERGTADVLLVLGDIGEDVGTFSTCLNKLRLVSTVRLYVLGNHDIYRSAGYGSASLRKSVLPNIASGQGYKTSPGVRRVGDVVIVVNSCWHNMSFRPPSLADCSDDDLRDAYRYGILDSSRIDVGYRELHRDDMLRFESQMRSLAEIVRPEDHLVVGTHWPIMRESYLPYKDNDASPKDAAFMAHEFGDVLSKTVNALPNRPASITTISGHTHFGHEVSFERDGATYRSIILDSTPTNMSIRTLEF